MRARDSRPSRRRRRPASGSCRSRAICIAPQYVAEDLLRPRDSPTSSTCRSRRGEPRHGGGGHRRGRTSRMNFAAPLVIALDGGAPIVVLAGVHAGCFELFGTERVRAIRDLKGKTVAMSGPGIDPARLPRQHAGPRGPRSAQGHHLGHPSARRVEAAPRRGQDRRVPRASRPSPRSCARGRSVTSWSNSTADRPWSQYFCCMVVANRDFVRTAPGGHQARLARDPQGRRTSVPSSPSAAQRASWRQGFTPRATTMRCRP